ncbi:MAG: endopeptidase La [Acutalibacteraceae bacterium]
MEQETQNQILPVLAMRDMVVFPKSLFHFDVVRPKSTAAVVDCIKNDKLIFIVSQKDPAAPSPDSEDLYTVGTVAKVHQALRYNNNNILRVVVEGLYRAKIVQYTDNQSYFEAEVEEIKIPKISMDTQVMAELLHMQVQFDLYVAAMPHIAPDIIARERTIENIGERTDYIADNMIESVRTKQKLLEEPNPRNRMIILAQFLKETLEIQKIEQRIESQAKKAMDDNQKAYILKNKMAAIKKELQTVSPDEYLPEENETEIYLQKIAELNLPEEHTKKLKAEVTRLGYMNASSQEASVIRTYLDTVLALPWNTLSKENKNLKKIRAVLDKAHYGMDKVKETIVENLAVHRLNPEANANILCLVGPPGVGKTSIARSIAKATGREYRRIALGGIHDESEIRGHRRTYVGAMMGRIMYEISQAKTKNPLILLDEVDKLGNDIHGDPTSALLEVLDREQNHTFYDHYVDMPFDLSKVMFITTANDASMISAPLKDRMDILTLESYTREEKFHIAKQHLWAKQLERSGLNGKQLKITDEAIYMIIDGYTREAGVRTLERTLEKIMRKVAVEILSEDFKPIKITKSMLEKYLGAVKYRRETTNGKDEIGVATGLAWTSVGGETLPVEVAVMEGTGKLKLTGSLGDVMKESAETAYTCVRSHAKSLGIQEDFYKTKDIHIHVPEGAVPKDGPSAGITMATAIASALSGTAVRHDVAMTGEITLRGRVLPIGGLKEKTIAAYRYGVNTVIIPKDNESDLEEIDPTVKEALTWVIAENIDTVFETAFVHAENSGEV